MARIPDEVIERLKREVSLEAVVRAKGIELMGRGDTLVGRCPFHDDRGPSFVVTPSKNLWSCLGACQTGGSVIDFVMRIEGVRFPLAIELLKRDFPSLAASSESAAKRPPKAATALKLEALAEPDESDEVVTERVLAHYSKALVESEEALGYLKSRGLEHPELLERFRLGYADRTLGYHVPRGNRAAGEALRGQLARLGFYRESGREHFYGSVTIPIFEADGQLAQMYGRKIRPQSRETSPHHLYMSRPHTVVWNVAALGESRDMILCEALFDALSFWCAGHRNVITSYGIEGFTAVHVAALKAHGTRRVLIAYDRDEAGDKAAEKLAPELAELGIEVFRVLFPRGMDANQYAQKMAPASKAFEAALRGARWLAGTRPVAIGEVETPEPAALRSEAESHESASEEAPAPLPPLAASSEAAPVREEEAEAEAAASPPPPAAPPAPSKPTVSNGEVTLHFGPRSWRVRGLEKVTSLSSMKLGLRVSTKGAFFMDSFDLCQARARAAFTKQAADELVSRSASSSSTSRKCSGRWKASSRKS